MRSPDMPDSVTAFVQVTEQDITSLDKDNYLCDIMNVCVCFIHARLYVCMYLLFFGEALYLYE